MSREWGWGEIDCFLSFGFICLLLPCLILVLVYPAINFHFITTRLLSKVVSKRANERSGARLFLYSISIPYVVSLSSLHHPPHSPHKCALWTNEYDDSTTHNNKASSRSHPYRSISNIHSPPPHPSSPHSHTVGIRITNKSTHHSPYSLSVLLALSVPSRSQHNTNIRTVGRTILVWL